VSVSEPTLSVVVCTRNRARILHGTLRALLAQEGMKKQELEIVVIDNGSTDGTAHAVSSLAGAGNIGIRYVVEPRVGLSAARNRGIQEARGEYLAFLDDDATPVRFWAKSIVDRFRAFDDSVAAIVGRITLNWQRAPARWIDRGLWSLFGFLDLGEVRRMSYGEAKGGNIAFRGDALRSVGVFREDLGLGRQFMLGEETELCKRIIEAGRSILFIPEMHVKHRVPAEKMLLSYVLRRLFASGKSKFVIVEKRDVAAMTLFERVMWCRSGLAEVLAFILKAARRWMWHGVRPPLSECLRLCHTLGFVWAGFRGPQSD